MVSASVGMSRGTDPEGAGSDAMRTAIEGLPQRDVPRLCIVLASALLDAGRVLAGVAHVAPGIPLVGVSTTAEVISNAEWGEGSVVVLVLGGDSLAAAIGSASRAAWNPKQSAVELVRSLVAELHGPPASVLVFLDAITGDGQVLLSSFVDAVRTTTGFDGVQVAGSAGGDQLLFHETHQYVNGKVETGALVALAFPKEVRTVVAAAHGFLPLSAPHRVTRAEGNMLLEIDGRPAVEMYHEYFGADRAAQLQEGIFPRLTMHYPLGVSVGGAAPLPLSPVAVDARGAIRLSGVVAPGSEVRLMIASRESALESAGRAAHALVAAAGGAKFAAVLLFAGVARRRGAGFDADEETRLIQGIIGRSVPLIGGAGYGQCFRPSFGLAQFESANLVLWGILAD